MRRSYGPGYRVGWSFLQGRRSGETSRVVRKSSRDEAGRRPGLLPLAGKRDGRAGDYGLVALLERHEILRSQQGGVHAELSRGQSGFAARAVARSRWLGG